MVRRIREAFWVFVSLLGSNWLSLLGASLTTVSAIMIIAFLLLGILGVTDSPYIGIMAFLVMPAVFLLGLHLIPLGIYLRKKRAIAEPFESDKIKYPTIDFNTPRVRHLAFFVTILTVVNVLLILLVTYEGVVFMESTEFCGTVCHTVMIPEYTTYIASPHARVKCVECHIGSGAPWFVRSKLSGVGQVFAVTFNTYERPIPTPVENLRPSRETCEECHWPAKSAGDRIRIIQKFAEDEANTPMKTVLLMRVGGTQGDIKHGIHGWHMDPSRETVYVATDRKREKIPWMRVTEAGKSAVEFATSEASSGRPEGELRTMDCIDCHNRPTHIYMMPDQAVDQALAHGRINRGIPFIRKVGVEVLTKVGARPDARQQIAREIMTYYEANHADFARAERGSLNQAIDELRRIHGQNVFPEMKINWGTYSNNLGHERFPGCFRCHDGEHVSKDGSAVEQDCEICHKILAQDEQNPEILKQLGVE